MVAADHVEGFTIERGKNCEAPRSLKDFLTYSTVIFLFLPRDISGTGVFSDALKPPSAQNRAIQLNPGLSLSSLNGKQRYWLATLCRCASCLDFRAAITDGMKSVGSRCPCVCPGLPIACEWDQLFCDIRSVYVGTEEAHYREWNLAM